MTKKVRPWSEPQFSQIKADWENPFIGLYRLPVIFGMTGPTKSGKTIMANHLVNLFGFAFVSMNTEIARMAHSLGEDVQDESKLRETAKRIRNQEGADIFAQRAMKKIRKELITRNIAIVDGILHPAEVVFFKNRFGSNFILIGVEANRTERAKAASSWFGGTEEDNYEKIKERDTYEQYPVDRDDPLAPNIPKCLIEAYNKPIKIDSFDKANLYTKIDNFVRGYFSRRSWDLLSEPLPIQYW